MKHKFLLKNGENIGRVQLALERHCLGCKTVQTVDGVRIDLEVERVARVLAVLNFGVVVVNVRVFLTGKYGILLKIFPSRFVVRLIDFQLAGNVFDGTLHLRQQLQTLLIDTRFHPDVQRVNLRQFHHKIVVVETEVAAVEGEQTGIDTAGEVEAQILLDQNLLVFRIENHILSLAHVHLWNALNGKVHIAQVQHGVGRARHCLRLEPDKVVVDFLDNAVQIAVHFRLDAAQIGSCVIIDYSFVCQPDKQTFGNCLAHSDVAR